MEMLLNISQTVLSFLLIGSILLQQRGTSLGAGFGGDSTVYLTKRGAEKVLFWASITFATLFFASAIIRLFVL